MKTTRLKILIIEDNTTDILLMTKIISQCSFTTDITTAQGIDEAIDICSREEFDCIFLDYYFPQKNGSDFIRYYNECNGSGSIIVVTYQDDVNIAVDCMKMGASDYLPKHQITVASIEKSLNYALRLRQARESAHRAEKALMESEMRLKSIIARSPILLFNMDGNGVFTLFKGKAASTLSITPEDVVGRKISDVDEMLPIRMKDYEKACKGEELKFMTTVNNRHFEVNYIPVYEQRRLTGMMGVALDITSFKKIEEELTNTLELTEGAARVKEQFLANMSHEIRTPIHGIISLAQFVLNTSLTEEQTNYLNLIRKSADTLLVIVNDILDLSKLDADKMTFEEVNFNLKDTIQSGVAAFIPKTIEKNIQLKTDVSAKLPEYISGDPVRLTQIINNLLGNAVKFTDKGFVSLTVNAAEENDKFLVLEFIIRDTGIGISPHKIHSIFENFSQAESDTTRKYGGTGLGLSITRRLIEKQNGMIHVESLLDAGTTFTVRIPYKRAVAEAPEDKTTIQNTCSLPSTLRLLVAEDNDINRFIIKKMLGEWGVQVEFATTGSEAVEYYSKQHFDLILMDVEMPGMNGYRATEIIRNELPENKKHVPIIALTGHALEGEKQKCITAGMNDYISKPFKPEVLKERIAVLTASCGSDNDQQPAAQTSAAPRCTDLTFLREISDNNEQFYREFVQMFLDNTPVAVTEMCNSLENLKWEALRQAAHKIKPSFNYVGLKELNQLAAKVEEMAKNQQNPAELKKMLARITEVCETAYSELRTELTIPFTV